VIPATRPRGRTPKPGWDAAAAFIGVALLACGTADDSSDRHAVGEPAAARFVTSAACASCHPHQHARWSGSHHDRAMEVANDETVLGNFDDEQFGQFPVMNRFTREDGAFVVTAEGPDGEPTDYPVKYTFGVAPLQQYLIEFPGGRLQSFTVAWDTERRRWFSLYPDERIPPEDPLHWTGRYQRWNLMCADCHSTALRKGYDLAQDSYTTTWAEIDVGCEACHGPGSRHVAWAEARDPGEAVDVADTGLAVDFAGSDARFQVEVCAPCH
jgi:hypothetical protein